MQLVDVATPLYDPIPELEHVERHCVSALFRVRITPFGAFTDEHGCEGIGTETGVTVGGGVGVDGVTVFGATGDNAGDTGTWTGVPGPVLKNPSMTELLDCF